MDISPDTGKLQPEINPPLTSSQQARHIVSHYEECLRNFGDSHRGVDWPNAADAETRYRVMLDVIRTPSDTDAGVTQSLLDFGCGASHLYTYLLATGRASSLKYRGVDLSEQFIALSRRKYPHLSYVCADLLESPDSIPASDYVVANGVFTEKCGLSFDQMLNLFQQLISALYQKARSGLAFNVMSTQVDWQRDDLFHVPFDLMAQLMASCASRKFVFRQDYGLYEYTVYVYR